MKKGIKWRLAFIAATVLLSVVFFLPSLPLYSKFPSWWGKFFPNKGITLGLDLQGGMHLVLEVEGEKAVENGLDRAAGTLKDLFAQKKMNVSAVRREGAQVIVTLGAADEKNREEVNRLVRENYPNLTGIKGEGEAIHFEMKEGEVNRIKEAASSQALETIRNRVDQFGVAEPLIQRQGPQQILIQLPGIKDPQRAIELIGKTALLEFKLVDDDALVSRDLPARIALGQETAFLGDWVGKIPAGDEILFERIVDKESNVGFKRPFLVKKSAAMTGDTLTDARVSIGQFSEPYVSITFDAVGAKLFEKVSVENLKKRMAIILDSSVYSAPVIQERISGGRAQISGSFTTQEANDLAIVLRAGALPAPVKIIQNVTVGPSLGADSIRFGFLAGMIGTGLVVAFMVIYYRFSGLIANFNLFLNVILLIGAMALLNATLTLPGIAGIILTVGMSVDSNVLIFERIREELRAGRPVRMAVDAGYDKAFLTIVDSHVTTLITAFVLFLFGTGPIKGFAVALSLGVMINLFTSLVGTKVIFDMINSRRRLETLSI